MAALSSIVRPPKLKGPGAGSEGEREAEDYPYASVSIYPKNVHQPWPLALKCGVTIKKTDEPRGVQARAHWLDNVQQCLT